MKRTIAAILAADVAGYSRLVAYDEEDTLARLADYSAVFRDCVAKCDGRIFNTAGDAILAEFPSAVAAVRTGLEIQEILRAKNLELPAERRMQFRMGITVGDVMERDDGDMLGDGVNVAARLEGLAEPGGICISRSVYEAVGNKVQTEYRSIGRQRLKGIAQPVHVFRVGVVGHRRRPTPLGIALRAVAAAIALLLCGGGVYWAIREMNKAPVVVAASSEAETAARAALSVSVARPDRQCFQDRVRLGGVVVPHRVVEVRPENDGYKVDKILAEPLAEVAAGDVLAQLSPPDPRLPAISIRAPVAGTVGASTASVGSLTAAQAPALFEIHEGGNLDLSADVPMAMLARLSPNQDVRVTPLGLSPIAGRIGSLSGGADPATQLGRVRVALGATSGLRAGTFARAVATVAERCGPSVPFSSLLRGPEGTAVFVTNGNVIEARPVETGLSSEDAVEITTGIADTDLVVQRAGPFLREGDVIRPITEQRTASAK